MERLYERYCACGYRVTTDSRAIRGGEIFFALRGENFDGNDYAMRALEAGAAAAVVASDAALPEGDTRLIRVADPLATLRDLAIWHRTHVRAGQLPVLGLTGTNGKTTTKNLIAAVLARKFRVTNGKTTTKNLIAAVLARKFRVTATRGNLNNDIGVPLSLLSITPDTEFAVIEMGANHPDDIAKLVRVSQPDYGLITNVGRAHLLGFGSFEGVKAAKGELYNWLGAHRGSLIFLNEDDPDLREMAAKQPCHVFGYGLKYQGAEVLPATPAAPFLRLRLGEDVIRTHLVGAYNATNVLAALAVGEYFGVARRDAIEAVEGFVPDNNRSQMVRTARNTLIVDAYNANPSSMHAALDNFRLVEAPRKLALLGDMRELGAESLAEHTKVLRLLLDAGIPACLVGDEFRQALDQLQSSRTTGQFRWYPDSAALADALAADPVTDTVLLIKGSHSIQMERVLDRL